MQQPEVRVPQQYPSVANLQGKVVAVTGAGRGLGHVIADAMAAHGADVAVCGRTEADLDKAAARIAARGRRAVACPCDVKSVADVRRFVGTIEREMGRLDVLVNNAGGGTRTPPDELTEGEWDQVMNTNVKGMFFVSQAAARLMRRGGLGRIINIASVIGVKGHPRFAAYATSKGRRDPDDAHAGRGVGSHDPRECRRARLHRHPAERVPQGQPGAGG